MTEPYFLATTITQFLLCIGISAGLGLVLVWAERKQKERDDE